MDENTDLKVVKGAVKLLSDFTSVLGLLYKEEDDNLDEKVEKLAKVNKIAFDKTGTLTYGQLNVNDIDNFSDFSDEKIMSLIFSLFLSVTSFFTKSEFSL